MDLNQKIFLILLMQFPRFMWAFLILSLTLTSAVAARAQEAAPDHWQNEISALVADDSTTSPPQQAVLFVGSSSIRLWTTLTADFPAVPTINRGFGGSMIADATRYVDRIVIPYKPKVVVLYAGDNDIAAGHSPEQIVNDFKAFVERVRRDLPTTVIVYISIKPSIARVTLWPQMRAANADIATWAKTQTNVRFVDIAAQMLDAEGHPRAELLRADGLHMTPAGYAIWIGALKPVLAQYGFVSR